MKTTRQLLKEAARAAAEPPNLEPLPCPLSLDEFKGLDYISRLRLKRFCDDRYNELTNLTEVENGRF